MNRTDRLHAIHEALRRAGPSGIGASRLASDLEVSVRTIKRDLSALQRSGAPVRSRPGPGGGYVLDASATLPPVAFTAAQAVALATASAVLPPASPFAVDVRSASGKVLDTLGASARARAEALAERVWVMAERPERSAPASVLRAIERSLLEQLVLTIGYRAADDTRSRRAVEPIIAAWTGGHWYLVAHCRERDAIRWFRVERIARADLTGERYEPRPVSDIGTPPSPAAPLARIADGGRR